MMVMGSVQNRIGRIGGFRPSQEVTSVKIQKGQGSSCVPFRMLRDTVINASLSISTHSWTRAAKSSCRPFKLRSRRGICLLKTVVGSSSSTAAEQLNKSPPPPIQLTDGALQHLKKLKKERGEEKSSVRMGVKSGGCSGMSYTMDFVTEPGDMRADDVVMNVSEDIEIRVDPKSLLYLFGLTLDYSDELIGGGYKFINPNANASCGCGTSFSI